LRWIDDDHLNVDPGKVRSLTPANPPTWPRYLWRRRAQPRIEHSIEAVQFISYTAADARSGAALQQFGTYDFQRDKATNTYFDEYVPAANYAIGVYMAGAGHNLAATYVIAQGYAMGHSSNWYKYWSRGRPWIKSGWEDAHAGYWKTR